MALITDAFDELLIRLARVLQHSGVPAVFVGGCASVLYRYSPQAAKVIPRPLLTVDADLAVPNNMTQRQPSLHDMLLGAGLRLVPDDRPSNKYRLSADANESVEIICPATGLSTKQRQSRPALVEVCSTTAEALDYVDVLMLHPWEVDLAGVPELKVDDSLPVAVPNPISFVLQKMLIRPTRQDRAKRQKDAYYVYETALIFREAQGMLEEEVEIIRKTTIPKWWREAGQTMAELFGAENAQGTLNAVAVGQANGINVTPTMIHRTIKPLLRLLQEAH